jgi:hypothetical protein
MADRRKERLEVFKAALDNAGVPEWGRAQAIVKATGCSAASAQAWIKGSLPSDAARVVELCDLYKIDLYLWVMLESREILTSHQKIAQLIRDAVLYVKELEEKSDYTFTAGQLAKLCAMYPDENKRDNISDIIDVMSAK